MYRLRHLSARPWFLAAFIMLFAAATTAQAQGNCLAIDSTETGELNGLGCITALTGELEAEVSWSFTESELNRRLIELTLESASGQDAQVELISDGKPVLTLSASDGAKTSQTLPLLPADYAFRFTASGDEGRLLLNAQTVGSPLGISTSPAGSSNRATRTNGTFARIGSLEGGVDYVRWRLNEEQAELMWKLTARGTPGFPLTLKLFSEDGDLLLQEELTGGETVELPDLQFGAADYTFVLSPESTVPQAGYYLALNPLGPLTDGNKTGSTGSHAGANRVSTATGVRGQLEDHGTDYFHLQVPEQDAGFYSLSANLDEQMNSLCLDGADQQELACWVAAADLVIPLLHLAEGDYWLRLSGSRGQNPAYELTFTQVAAPESDIIVPAPAGTRATAFTLPESLGVRVTHPSRTTTWLELPLAESGLYRVQVMGNGDIRNLTVTDGGGGRIRNERRNRLDNVPLRLGSNYIGLDADAGDYAIRVLHLGPLPADEPQPAQEAVEVAADEATGEPALIEARPAGTIVPAVNHQPVDAARLSAGRDYVSTIDGPDAHYRFSLQNEAHVRLTLTPPEDGQMRLRLTPAVSGDRTTSEPGEQLTLNHWLPAGDYRVEVRMNNGSTGWYTIRLDLLDSLDLPLDLHPLDASNARPIPADHVLQLPASRNESMTFHLPVLQQDGQLDIHAAAGEVQAVWVTRAPEVRSGSRVNPLTEDRDNQTASFALEAGVEYLLSLRATQAERWDLQLDFGEALPARDVPDLQQQLELALEFAGAEVSAWSRYGQTLDAAFSVTNGSDNELTLDVLSHTSDPRVVINGLPQQLTLAAGETSELPLDLVLPADLRSDGPLTVTLGLQADSGAIATTAAELLPRCDAPQSGAHFWWPSALADRTYWNYARSTLGASISGFPSNSRDVQLIDGRVSPATPSSQQGKYYVLDLGQPRTVHATMLHPLANGDAFEGLRDFRISASDDGEVWETILEASMSSALIEQLFEFPEPVTTRFMRLDPLSNQARSGRGLNIGEWKLLGTDDPFERINLADAALGGHLVASNVLQSMDRGMLEDGQHTPHVTTAADGQLDWVLGFHDNHAALVSGLEWQEYELRNNRRYIPAVRVSVSTDSPLGPWEQVTDWQLPQTTELAELAFDEPVWARFIRFEALLDLEEPERVSLNLPTSLRVLEHQGDGYRSILSEWGMGSQHASFEYAHPELLELARVSFGDNGEPASADFLEAESSGFVQTGAFEAWYDFDVTEEAAHVTLQIDSSVGVALDWQVFDAEAELVAEGSSDRALRRTLPPGSYQLRIAEPPRSIVFLWDNSGSVSPFSPMIYAALDRFATEITRGQEEVMLAVFATGGANFLLPDWSGDASEVSRALNDYDRSDGASDSPNALLATNPLLAERRGSRSILLITDAETGFNATPDMWRSFTRPQPQVFSLHVSTASSDYSEDFMQDVASAYGGHYTLAPTAGDLEVGLLRADCLIRRPKPYNVSIAFEDRQPEPGTLSVQSPASSGGGDSAPAGTGSDAIEVILDASGSMWQTLDGRYRYEIANEVLIDLVNNVLPEEAPFALRVFGNREAEVCRSDLEVSLAPLDPAAVAAVIADIEPKPFAGTPLAESIQLAAQDLAGASGARTLILITDGEESCDGDVEAAITELRSAGVDVVLNIIGFDFDATDPEAARERFREWASLGGGQYFDASDAAELADALEQSVAVGYEVVDAAGNVVGRGTIDGPAVQVPGGTFTVRVIGEPGVVIEGVHIDGGEVEVEVPE